MSCTYFFALYMCFKRTSVRMFSFSMHCALWNALVLWARKILLVKSKWNKRNGFSLSNPRLQESLYTIKFIFLALWLCSMPECQSFFSVFYAFQPTQQCILSKGTLLPYTIRITMTWITQNSFNFMIKFTMGSTGKIIV